MIARLAPLLCSIVVFASAGASADAVRVSDGYTFGQGWMFLDQDGACKVVTAAHVALGHDGALRSLRVLTDRGRDLTPVEPEAVSSELDIIVLPVPAANDPTLCGGDRISVVGLERRLRGLTGAFVLVTNQSENVRVPVEPRAASTSDGGVRFAVRPVIPSDRVAAGWSGGVVMDAEGPLGIVTNVGEDNEALAVRIDAVRNLLARNATDTSSILDRPPSVTVFAGRTLDPAHGPDHVLDESGIGWVVEPRGRTVVLTASLATPVQVRSSELEVASGAGNSIEEIAIATSAEPAGSMIDVNRCPAIAGTPRIVCTFAPRTVRVVRFVVKTRREGVIELRRLAVR